MKSYTAYWRIAWWILILSTGTADSSYSYGWDDALFLSTAAPTLVPTEAPSVFLTLSATLSPTDEPTLSLTMPPASTPASSPTDFPTVAGTADSSYSYGWDALFLSTVLTEAPPVFSTLSTTLSPTDELTLSLTMPPTDAPALSPTDLPTVAAAPTFVPTEAPTVFPTLSATPLPTDELTLSLTMPPTTTTALSPTDLPTVAGTADGSYSYGWDALVVSTANDSGYENFWGINSSDSDFTSSGTDYNTAFSTAPSAAPTTMLTLVPTAAPTTMLTLVPTAAPTMSPTIVPTAVFTSAPTIFLDADSTYTASFTIALEGVNASSLTETVLNSTKHGMASLLGFSPMQVTVSVMSRRRASSLGRILSSSSTMNIEISGLGSSEITNIEDDISTATSDGSFLSVFKSAGLPVVSLSVSQVQIASTGSNTPQPTSPPSIQPTFGTMEPSTMVKELFLEDPSPEGTNSDDDIPLIVSLSLGSVFIVAVCLVVFRFRWKRKQEETQGGKFTYSRNSRRSPSENTSAKFYSLFEEEADPSQVQAELHGQTFAYERPRRLPEQYSGAPERYAGAEQKHPEQAKDDLPASRSPSTRRKPPPPPADTPLKSNAGVRKSNSRRRPPPPSKSPEKVADADHNLGGLAKDAFPINRSPHARSRPPPAGTPQKPNHGVRRSNPRERQRPSPPRKLAGTGQKPENSDRKDYKRERQRPSPPRKLAGTGKKPENSDRKDYKAREVDVYL